MEHAQPKMAGKYRTAFTWHKSIGHFVRSIVTETPLLHVCSGASDFGDVRVDRFASADVCADWRALPFSDNSFGAVFADPPWNVGYMKHIAYACREALRVAPVAYIMAPWLWVNRYAKRDRIWVREFPGVNIPVLIVRYERANQLVLPWR